MTGCLAARLEQDVVSPGCDFLEFEDSDRRDLASLERGQGLASEGSVGESSAVALERHGDRSRQHGAASTAPAATATGG